MPNNSEMTLDLELKVTREEDRWHLKSDGKSFGSVGGYEDLEQLKAMGMGIVIDGMIKFWHRLDDENHRWDLTKARRAKRERNTEVFGGHSTGDVTVDDHMSPYKGMKEAPRKVKGGRKPGLKNSPKRKFHD